MSILVTDCPRCGAKEITFEVMDQQAIEVIFGWKQVIEVFCCCRKCQKTTVFQVTQKQPSDERTINSGLRNYPMAINNIVEIISYVSVANFASVKPPEFLPKHIESAFKEGVSCLSINCVNAAATMFRLCLDFATKGMLPQGDNGPSLKVARSLGLRLQWLFENEVLPESLKELSMCIKDDGNDGAHEGLLDENDARDILDFTIILLERIYTEPERLIQAKVRRNKRHEAK